MLYFCKKKADFPNCEHIYPWCCELVWSGQPLQSSNLSLSAHSPQTKSDLVTSQQNLLICNNIIITVKCSKSTMQYNILCIFTDQDAVIIAQKKKQNKKG